MNAIATIIEVAKTFKTAGLEAVMIGNAAAAIQGAPITTLDIDFIIRDGKKNQEKLIKVAKLLNAELLSFNSGVTSLKQIQNVEKGIFLDFVTMADGIKSFASIRSRSTEVDFNNDGAILYIASLEDIIASKKATGRPKDKAVIHELEVTLEQKKERKKC